MALKDLPRADLLDFLEAAVRDMRKSELIDRLQGLSLAVTLLPLLRDRIDEEEAPL